MFSEMIRSAGLKFFKKNQFIRLGPTQMKQILKGQPPVRDKNSKEAVSNN